MAINRNDLENRRGQLLNSFITKPDQWYRMT